MKTEQELRPDWIQELASSPFNEPMFTEEMKSSVLNNAANGSVRMGRKTEVSNTSAYYDRKCVHASSNRGGMGMA